MTLTYDTQTDTAYLTLSDEPVHASFAVECEYGDAALNYDARGRLVGIEIADASRRMPAAFTQLTVETT